MYDLVRTLFVSDSRFTSREACKLWIRRIALNDMLYGEVPVVENECRLEWLLLIWYGMAGRVDPVILDKLICGPGNAGIRSFDAFENSEITDESTKIQY